MSKPTIDWLLCCLSISLMMTRWPLHNQQLISTNRQCNVAFGVNQNPTDELIYVHLLIGVGLLETALLELKGVAVLLRSLQGILSM